MNDVPGYVLVNRTLWDASADEWVGSGERHWADDDPSWGIWGIPESALGLLPEDMTGMSAIELGCGTGYVSAWMARRGARVVGIDNSLRQLETAARLRDEHRLDVEFLHAIAEAVPYPDESFDFAISEYGAALWSDPYTWIPEAWRVLRPGGSLVFLSSTAWTVVCAPRDGSTPIADRLIRDYFGLHATDWSSAEIDPGGVEFHLPIGDWFALFRDTGFAVEDFRELRAPEPGDEVRFFVSKTWAHRYPSEQVWKLRKP